MRIRLHGTPAEIEHTLAKLDQVLDITDTSRLCHDRGTSPLVRVYLQVDIDAASQSNTVR